MRYKVPSKDEYFKSLREIREVYNGGIIQEIFEAYPLMLNPYFYTWDTVFTPIERNVWSDIRYLCLPFYPQFPVGKYFVDFGDPIKKIGIEVDSRKFHVDKKRDEKRQKEMEEMGWTIYRFWGWETYKERKDYFLEDKEEHEEGEKLRLWNEFITKCSEGKLIEIKIRHYKDFPVMAAFVYGVNTRISHP